MPWKAPITAERADFTDPGPQPRGSVRRRLVGLAVVIVAVVASLIGLSAWRSREVPTAVSWCARDWNRSPTLPPAESLPPNVSPSLPWTVATKTFAGSFYLPLDGTGGCPAKMPTVGYLEHDDHYISYALSGGP